MLTQGKRACESSGKVHLVIYTESGLRMWGQGASQNKFKWCFPSIRGCYVVNFGTSGGSETGIRQQGTGEERAEFEGLWLVEEKASQTVSQERAPYDEGCLLGYGFSKGPSRFSSCAAFLLWFLQAFRRVCGTQWTMPLVLGNIRGHWPLPGARHSHLLRPELREQRQISREC